MWYLMTFIVRISLAIKDGLSDRAAFSLTRNEFVKLVRLEKADSWHTFNLGQSGIYNDHVGWLPWHLFGWIGRDLPIALFYLDDIFGLNHFYDLIINQVPISHAFVNFNWPIALLQLFGLTAAHWICHIVFYSFAVNYAHWFDWGNIKVEK